MRNAFSFELPPADYPNHLALPEPERPHLPTARRLLVLLILLCLIPRAVTAWRLPCICIDGAIYVNTARALEEGNFRGALMEGAINVYPVILMALHQLGLGWETAGALWGVTISCLVLLPLWGLARRQFDDRVALVACLLYIVHPKFIQESPEVMRDATFWFLFMLSLYCMWRAITEVRYGYFIATGAAVTLAALTRVEGLFLLIPLALWTFWRWLALRTDRRKLLVGAVLCVMAFPLLLVLINAAILYQHLGVTTIRVSPLARVQPWLESIVGIDSNAGDDAAANHTPLGRMLWVFFPTMTRGLAPLFALLMFGGIWGWRRVWARRDHQALFCTAVVIMCGIWVQLWYDGNISRRYPLPIVLMASPLAALGLLWSMDWVRRIGRWLGWQAQRQQTVAVLVMTGILVSGIGHAMTSKDAERRMAADVGQWVHSSFGTPPKMVGPSFMERIVRYYADESSYTSLRPNADDAAILGLVAEQKPDVVILWPTKRLSSERCASLAERMTPAGLRPIAPEALPEAAKRYIVLVRTNRLECARKPTPGRQ